jgi:carbon starvation protein CstA
MPVLIGDDPSKTWDLNPDRLRLYRLHLPVWLLLQPRDYLSSFLLYGSVHGGFIGMLPADSHLLNPSFHGWGRSGAGLIVFPFCSSTVACGACSDFTPSSPPALPPSSW